KRMQLGMVDEVRRLLDAGASIEFMMKLGLEYRHIAQLITGEFANEDEMCAALSLAIKRFAKRQMIWFRRDKDIKWIDMQADPIAEACALTENFLKDI
ncbi:MAG: tRNA dimethylallyltransferase, partial [Clostridia bacterium]|nr:tRNA dimethylallyltransferase [Clostridia bacterium]